MPKCSSLFKVLDVNLICELICPQLKAALHFADSLSGLLSRATEETQKVKGARKLEVGLYNNNNNTT